MATLAITPIFGSTTHRHQHAAHTRTVSAKKGKKKVARIHGQRAIDSDRAAEIQNALIHKKYLTGEPADSGILRPRPLCGSTSPITAGRPN